MSSGGGVCRLKHLGLSTAGNKRDLEARLQHSAPAAGGQQQADASGTQPDLAAEKPKAKVRGAATTGVFKAQKRRNFVRINLKVRPALSRSAMPDQNGTCIHCADLGLTHMYNRPL